MRGFLALPLALGIVIAVLAAGLYVQTRRVESAKAELQVCADRYAMALASIEKQNKAVDALKSASEKALERSNRASEQARKGQVAALSEVDRLRASKPVPGGCPAADGVAAVRQGLAP